MIVGTQRTKCRVCGEYIFHQPWEVDRVHNCRNADGTRKTTKTQFNLIPGKVNLKIDVDHWNQLGANPLPYLRSEKEKKDSVHNEVTVETFVIFD